MQRCKGMNMQKHKCIKAQRLKSKELQGHKMRDERLKVQTMRHKARGKGKRCKA